MRRESVLIVPVGLLIAGCKRTGNGESKVRPAVGQKTGSHDASAKVLREPAPPPAATPGAQTVPTGASELFAELGTRSSATWAESESTAHLSKGPHTSRGKPVRVFVNDVLTKYPLE